MDVCVSRLSSKGQLVLPKGARRESNAKEGDEFVIISDGARISMFKLGDEPKKALLSHLSDIASKGEALARKRGLKREADVVSVALKRR